jgi:hypothetical protein
MKQRSFVCGYRIYQNPQLLASFLSSFPSEYKLINIRILDQEAGAELTFESDSFNEEDSEKSSMGQMCSVIGGSFIFYIEYEGSKKWYAPKYTPGV